MATKIPKKKSKGTKKTAAKKLEVVEGTVKSTKKTKKRRRTREEINAELRTLPIEERIQRASRRFKVDDYGSLDQAFLVPPTSKILNKILELNFRALHFGQKRQVENASKSTNTKGLMPVEIPMFQVLEWFNQGNGSENVVKAVALTWSEHVDQEFIAVFLDWYDNTFLKHVENAAYNNEPFEFRMAEAVFNQYLR